MLPAAIAWTAASNVGKLIIWRFANDFTKKYNTNQDGNETSARAKSKLQTCSVWSAFATKKFSALLSASTPNVTP
jgi:hypothetical protein